MNQNHFVIFETAPKYCILDSLIDYEDYSISSKEFLSTVVDIMVIWVKFIHFINLSSLIAMMSMLNLAISCLTTSNLPWFKDLTLQVLIQYCSWQHLILLSPLDTFTTECHCSFGPAASFYLKLSVIALHSYPVAYWTPSNLGASSSVVMPLCIFTLFIHGVL